MNWARMIAAFIADKRIYGDFNSPLTERQYRDTLETLSDYCHGRGPVTANRDDVKRCLAHWPNANTCRVRRAHMVSFFDWMVEEEHRDFNPARQTRKVKGREPVVVRWTLAETRAFLAAAITPRERRVAFLGVGQGLRNAELRALRGENFDRPGFVRVVGKGNRERVLPLLADVLPVVEEIRRNVGANEYVIAPQVWTEPGVSRREDPTRPVTGKTVGAIVRQVAKRAGLGYATPHVMRRAFADFVWGAGENLRLTQHLLGHSNPSTTNTYLSKLSPETLAASVAGMDFGLQQRPGDAVPSIAVMDSAVSPDVDRDVTLRMYEGNPVAERVFAAWLLEVQGFAAARGAFYREALR